MRGGRTVVHATVADSNSGAGGGAGAACGCWPAAAGLDGRRIGPRGCCCWEDVGAWMGREPLH